MLRFITLGALIGLSLNVVAWSTVDDWAAIVVTQLRSRQPLPALSTYGAGLDVASAYAVQHQVLDELTTNDKIAGFRVSLTRPLGQVRFKVHEPVTSAVLHSGLLRGTATFKLRDFKRLQIAPALGYVLKVAVAKRLNDLKELDALIGSVVPAVDFSNFDFERETDWRGEDLIAANGAFVALLVGKPLAAIDANAVNSVLTELTRDGQVIDRGRAVNVMGSQYTALYWLINRLLDQGWALQPGTVLVTGPLSDPVPAKPGKHIARYWDASDVTFTVE
ncbi:MAG: hypothetical protein HYX63_21035 [Gammaproteobacteria bacterium]|nr:hypothetical protein [Gammaproteobacteria bacterium]